MCAPSFSKTTWLLVVFSAVGMAAGGIARAEIRYVDDSAAPGGDGRTWATAYSQLQSALSNGDPSVLEIRVAGGTYRGTFGVGLALRGGYAGLSDPNNPDRRDFDHFETVLSGDINGDDGPDFANYDENVGPVLTVGESGAVDGFTISSGLQIEQWRGPAGADMRGGRLIRCRLVKNLNVSGTCGVAINVSQNEATIQDCIITGNRGRGTGDDAAVFNYYCEPGYSLINCVVADNDCGGARSLDGAFRINNCTIANNAGAGLVRGSIECGGFGEIQNTILFGNLRPVECLYLGGISISYCDIQGLDPNYSGCVSWGPGNIDADPRFVDSNAGDFHLSAGSPCIDAGDNGAVPAGIVSDLGGNVRFFDDPLTPDTGNGVPPIVDMGSYEYQRSPGPMNWYVDDDAAPSGNGLRWETAFSRLDDAIVVAQATDEIRVAGGTYRGGFSCAALLRGGYAGLAVPADPNRRDSAKYESTLSGDVNGDDLPGFVNYGDNAPHILTGNCNLDGFTITGASGGAVYAPMARVTIRHCRFIRNTGNEGAAVVLSGTPQNALEDCQFESNGSAPVVFAVVTELQMSRCSIANNDATGVFGGYLYGRIDDCLIASNAGPGCYLDMSHVTLTNCTIVRNTDVGVRLVSGSDVSTLDIVNSIMRSNAGNQVQLYLSGGIDCWATTTVSYCDIQGGQAAVVVEQGNTLNWGNGNFDADPLFVSPNIGDFRLDRFSPCIDAGDNAAVPAGSAADVDGRPRFFDDLAIPDAGSGTPPVVDIGAQERQQPSLGPVAYVKADAVPGGRGATWETAFTDLQEALLVAESTPSVEQIWVAHGVYKPTGPGGDPNISFVPLVPLYGGFRGTETAIEGRDLAHNVTILSGDLNGDDGPDFENYGDNSHNVVWASYAYGSPPVVIDGVTIQSAAEAALSGDWGASVELRRTRITQNIACCTEWGAGALEIWLGTMLLDSCTVDHNQGTGVFAFYSHLRAFRTRIVGNSGGGVWTYAGSNHVLDNCLVTDNGAEGVIVGGSCNFRFDNDTIVRNAGVGISVKSWFKCGTDFHGWFYNSILRSNVDGQMSLEGDSPAAAIVEVAYSALEGGPNGVIISPGGVLTWGPGNIDADPLFFDPLGSDGIAGTLDDDFRLGFHSPCIDVGNNDYLSDPNGTDLDGYPRRGDDPSMPNNGHGTPPIVDLGAYESHQWCPGDLTHDLRVGLDDLVMLLGDFGMHGTAQPGDGDLDGDHDVDLADLSMLLTRYGTTCY